MIGRVLAAAAVGLLLGWAWWVRANLWNPQPPPLELCAAVGAMIGVLLAMFVDLPLLPGGDGNWHGSGDPLRTTERVLAKRAAHPGRVPRLDPKWALDPALAPLTYTIDEVPSRPAWSTAIAALLCAAVALVTTRPGLWLCSQGSALAHTKGDPFWWGFDELVSFSFGMGVSLMAAAVLGTTLAGLVAAIGLLRRWHRARTGALLLFVNWGIAAIVLFLGETAPLVQRSPYALGAAIACGAGVVLLFLPTTNADFGGLWGPLFLRHWR